MKRFLSAALILCFICALYAPAARANSWGLTGALYGAVSSVHTWDDYSASSAQVGDAAVMHSRYHNVLMLYADKTLRVYARAVYQPGEGPGKTKLEKGTNGLFTLSYGEGGTAETYEFGTYNGVRVLIRAVIRSAGGTFTVALNETGPYDGMYTASDTNDEEAICQRSFLLSAFNISLFPRSVQEVRALNLMYAALDSGDDCLGYFSYPDEPGALLNNVGSGTAAVYSSPYGASAWRAAKSKAAVGLSGDMWLMRRFQNADGESYTAVRYNVSERTQRIGFVKTSLLGKTADGLGDSVSTLINIDVCAAEDTYLTDDPDVSQFAQFTVPKGTRFSCIGLYNRDYAYVAAEVKNGKFTDGGAIVWGFVPLKALEFPEGESIRGDAQTDVMERLAGEWEFIAGGNMAEDVLYLNADGTFQGTYYVGDYDDGVSRDTLESTGVWKITAYNPARNLYWNAPEYELTLIRDDGTATVHGLTLTDEGFSLSDWEGGGGYARTESDGDGDANGDWVLWGTRFCAKSRVPHAPPENQY